MKITSKVVLDDFLSALDECHGDVVLISPHGDTYNLKSPLSKYIALGHLLDEHGDELELFCYCKTDEPIMLRFFDSHREFL